VLVKLMNADARPTDRAPATQRRFSKSGFRWKSFVIPTPMIAENTWPRIALRGWASGESIVLYSRIAAAPYNQHQYIMGLRLGGYLYQTCNYCRSSKILDSFSMEHCFNDQYAREGPDKGPEPHENGPNAGHWL